MFLAHIRREDIFCATRLWVATFGVDTIRPNDFSSIPPTSLFSLEAPPLAPRDREGCYRWQRIVDK